ncbi:hypothetical protein M3570_22320, partial [Bacillus subtilis]|nr:hypothetical protein [Bacillus subtilis]
FLQIFVCAAIDAHDHHGPAHPVVAAAVHFHGYRRFSHDVHSFQVEGGEPSAPAPRRREVFSMLDIKIDDL